MVNHHYTDYAGMAKAAGLKNTWTLESPEQVERAIPDILNTDGPTFAVLRVEAESGFLGNPPMTYEGPEMKYRFGRTLEKKLGITVFGPQGY